MLLISQLLKRVKQEFSKNRIDFEFFATLESN